MLAPPVKPCLVMSQPETLGNTQRSWLTASPTEPDELMSLSVTGSC